MSTGGPSSAFLIAGVVINVLITALAIWWLVKQGVKKPPPNDGDPPPDQS